MKWIGRPLAEIMAIEIFKIERSVVRRSSKNILLKKKKKKVKKKNRTRTRTRN